ncbi:MAG: hydroxymethylbilane synthase [Bacteroidota bacterium]
MPENRIIRIGTRGSDLALWQANFVKASLEKLGQQVEIQIIHTQGDKIQDLSFDKLEGKGFFTKEIEQALLEKQVDLAVHSHKDLETTSPDGLTIAAVSDREDPSELLLIRKESFDQSQFWNLKQNAIIGTSSVRRKSQILAHRSDLSIKDLRGNVPTRINKLREGHYDAILLAKAGVNRLELDLSDLHCETLNATEFIPAPAQGVLGLQIRSEDMELMHILVQLNHAETQARIEIERGVLKKMEGGCQLPLGVFCEGEKVHVSFSENSAFPAKYFVFQNDNQDLINDIVSQLKSI